eukprot:m.135433 g.135433  ORF g.135433 m.135433 type:complete len:726 (+) comp20162_c0_seq1:150-2327(+)
MPRSTTTSLLLLTVLGCLACMARAQQCHSAQGFATVSLSSSSNSIKEGKKATLTAQLKVNLTAAGTLCTQNQYSVQLQLASAGSQASADDIKISPDFALIKSGDKVKQTQTFQFEVTALRDKLVELDEKAVLQVIVREAPVGGDASATGGTVIASATANLVLVSKDVCQVSIQDVRVPESAGQMVFKIELSNPVDVPVRLNVSSTPVTADAGTDFTPPQQLQVTASAQTKTVSVNFGLTPDTVIEPNEVFKVRIALLDAGGRDVEVLDPLARGVIVDDDFVFLQVSDVSILEDLTGQMHTADFSVTLSSPLPYAITVSYFTRADTAEEGRDYVAKTGTLEFPVGKTQLTVSVPLVPDNVAEDDERFFLHLHNVLVVPEQDAPAVDAGGLLLSKAIGVATILNDDVLRLHVVDPTPREGEGGVTRVEVRVRSTNPSDVAFTVAFSTEDLDAVSYGVFADYEPYAGTLTFARGETEHTFFLNVLGDIFCEPDEHVAIRFVGVQFEQDAVRDYELSSTSQVTIVNDERCELSLRADRVREGNNGEIRTYPLLLALSDPLQTDLALTVSTKAFTAKAPEDYLPFDLTTVVLSKVTQNGQIVVSIVGDDVYEYDEIFYLEVSSVLDTRLPSTVLFPVTITDDDCGKVDMTECSFKCGKKSDPSKPWTMKYVQLEEDHYGCPVCACAACARGSQKKQLKKTIKACKQLCGGSSRVSIRADQWGCPQDCFCR